MLDTNAVCIRYGGGAALVGFLVHMQKTVSGAGKMDQTTSKVIVQP